MQRPALSEHGQALVAEFVDSVDFITKNGKSIAQEFASSLSWKRDKRMELYAAELLELHAGSLELEAHGDALAVGACSTNGRVEHVGLGVFVEHNTVGVDEDADESPETITRNESRDVARDALSLVDLEQRGMHFKTKGGKARVAVVGHQGIGKTRGILAYTLQELLWRGEVVMRVGYKSNSVHLFVPEKDGTYRVWQGADVATWYKSVLAHDVRTFVLIDPPEKGAYSHACSARMIKFVPNHEDRHYHNFSKDGHLLFTSMPTVEEVLVMIPTLWNEHTAFPGQELESAEQKEEEVRRRCALVGRVPRLVFDAEQFKLHLQSITSTTAKLVANSCLQHLCEYSVGSTCGAWGPAGSDLRNHFLMETAAHNRRRVLATLSPVTSLLLRRGLEKYLHAFEGSSTFLFWRLPPKLLRLVVPGHHKHVRVKTHEATSDAIRNLALEDSTVVVASNDYPVLDFATSRTTWFMAKAGKTPPTVEASAFVTLLLDLDLAYKDRGELVMKDHDVQISLTVVRTNDKCVPKSVVKCSETLKPHEDLEFGQVEDVFDRHVQVEARCLCGCFAEEDRRTLELWNYFRPYAGLDELTPLAAS